MAPRTTDPRDMPQPLGPGDLAHVSNAPTGTFYEYDIPASLADEADGVVSVRLVTISPNDELNAVKRSRGDGARLAYELAKECLRALVRTGPNGAPAVSHVDTASGSADVVWAKMHAKIRNLVMVGYSDLHNPKDAENAGFLKSRKVTTG